VVDEAGVVALQEHTQHHHQQLLASANQLLLP
jgi:hypothetical protein